MGKRIVTKILPINNPYDKRIVYVVDKNYQFLNKKKALAWTKKYNSKGRIK